MAESIFYLILNGLRTYILYRFIGLFFEKGKQKTGILYGYAIYYLFNCVGYLLLKNDLVNLLTNTVGLLLVVLLCYQGHIARKIVAFIASYGMGILTENIAWVVFVKDKGDEMFAFGFFFATITLVLSEIII